MEDFTAEPTPTVDEQQAPGQPAPPRLKQTFDYIKQQKLKDVADALPESYEEFEAGMSDPDNVKALHGVFKDQKWEGAELDEQAFANLMLDGVKKKAQSAPSSDGAGGSSATAGPTTPGGAATPLTADDELTQQMGAFEPGAPLTPQSLDEPFANQPAGPAPVAMPPASLVPGEIANAQQVPEGPQLTEAQDMPAYLAAHPEERARLVEQEAKTLPPVEDGFERVPLPADFTGPEAPGTYQVPNSATGQKYIDRPLSKEVDGKEQTTTEAAFRNFGNQLLTMGQGGLDYLGAADRKLHATMVGRFLDSFDEKLGAAPYDASDPNVFQAGADAIEGAKGKVAPFYEASKFRLTNPKTWAMATSNVAALAVPALLSVAFPEGRIAEAAQAVAGAGFDMQMLEGSFQRARAAGLKGDQLDNYALADGAATMLVFKLGGLGLNAAGQQLAKTELMATVREQLARTGTHLSEGALGEAFAKAGPRLAAILKSSAQEGSTMGVLMAANTAKDKVGEHLANEAMGKTAFPEQSLGQDVGDVLRSGGEGVVLGGSLGAVRGLRPPTPTAVPLGESPTRGPLYAEFGPDRLTVRYLDAKGEEVDFGPAGPPAAVHQAVGAARVRSEASLPHNEQQSTPVESTAETATASPETAAASDVAAAPAAVEPSAAAGAVSGGTDAAGAGAAPEVGAVEASLPQSAPIENTVMQVDGNAAEASLPQSEQQATPAPAYATPAENRSNGRFEKDGTTYTRQAPLGEKVARGNATTAEFSSGVQQPVQYAVMEAADLQPSHTGGTQNLNHFLPEAQPKNRSAAFDPASQKAIGDIAASPDLARLGEAPNAYSGAPIVNGRGEALQGNGRGEGIRQHYARGGTSYKADVVAAAEKVGIPAEKTAGFREPVLVRVADVSDQRARELGNYTAADTESGGKRRLDARQAAGRMNDEDRGTLTRLATPRGDATLTETVRGNTEEILRFLRKAGLVNETQLQTMVKGDGTLTPQGVEDIAGLYRHQLFREGDPNLPELFAELPGPAQGGLDRAVGALLGVPESASLVPEVQNAIGGVREFMSSGTDFNTWSGQADMFRGGAAPRERFTPLELKLIELLATEKRPTYIARLFNEYAAAVKGEAASLFGETPPKPRAEAVKETFGVTDEPRNPSTGNSRTAESPARPVDADRRPTPPVAPDAPGAGEAGQPAAEPAAADNAAARAGGEAGAAADAGPERGPVVAPKAVAVRVMGGYLASDGTRFTGTGAKARAAAHSEQVGLVGRRVKAYDGSIDVVEGVTPKADGSGYNYTVRGEADGQTRTHGTKPAAKDILPSAYVTDTNVGDMPAPLRPTQERAAALDAEYVKLQAELVEAKNANPTRGQALATLVPLPTITPAEASVYVKMITNRLQKGVVKVADLLAELRASLGPQLGAASDEDLTKVIQYAKDERQEEADLTRAAVVQDLPARQQELEQRLFGSVTATEADFSPSKTGKVTGALSNLQEKLVSKPARAVGAALNSMTNRAAVSKNAFARELVYAVNAVSKGFVQTREQQLASESFIGQARERPAKEAEVLYKGFTERLRDATLTDPVASGAALRTSLRRIDRVLDPTFYEARTRPGFEALLQERMDPADFAALGPAEIDRLFDEHTSLLSAEQLAAAGKLEESDLTPQELAVYDDLKLLYSFVHDANFAIGKLSYNTWEAGRDMDTGEATYAARLYQSYELPDDLAPAWKKAMGSGGRKMESGLYKQREELEAWKIANKVEDPVFAAVKRLRQTMANRAIHDYGQWIIDNQPHLVVAPKNQGVKAQEAARQEGESRGFVQLDAGYGALSGKWVAPHVAEDFKGGFFTNAFMQRIFEITKAYGSGDTSNHLVTGSLGKMRNMLKKSVTVYNPGTHMGNILNNVTLGWFAGVDGVSMAAEQVGAVQELKAYSPTVRYLLDRGVLGGSLASGEFKQNLESFESAFAPEPPKSVVARGLGKMEEFYQATDTVAKVALFRSLVKQGLSAEAAADRVAGALQNNKRVGKAYDVGANVPLVGQAFVRWSADLARILGTAAVNRPLSVAAFAVGLRVLGNQLSQAAGETEAERRLREAGASRIPLPQWLGGNISTSLKVSKSSTVDFSRWFIPFYLYGGYDDDSVGGETLSKFSPIWLKNGSDFLDGEFDYTSNPAGPRSVALAKMSQDPLLGPLAQLALDADFRGKPISDVNATSNNPSTATPLEKSAAQAHYALRAALPGTGPLLDDVYQAARDRENYFGKKRSVGMTLARFLGFKMEQFGTEQYYKALVRTTLTAQREMEGQLKLAGQVPDDVVKGVMNGSVSLHALVPRLRYRSAKFMEAYVKYATAQQLAQDFLTQAASKHKDAQPAQ